MKYDYHVNVHQKKRFLRRSYITITLVFLLIAGAVVALRLDGQFQKDRNSDTSTTGRQTTGYFAPPTQIFTTPHFQFQTNKNWAEVPAESTKNKFVYRSLRNSLVEHELQIYVDEIPGLAANRVLPVELTDDFTEIKPTSVSEHCNKSPDASRLAEDRVVSISKVRVLCDFDNTRYEVLVGVMGGSTTLTLKRPSGSTSRYLIFYRNVTARPDVSQLSEIINTFQTR